MNRAEVVVRPEFASSVRNNEMVKGTRCEYRCCKKMLTLALATDQSERKGCKFNIRHQTSFTHHHLSPGVETNTSVCHFLILGLAPSPSRHFPIASHCKVESDIKTWARTTLFYFFLFVTGAWPINCLTDLII